jgi:hypothetical protein
MKLLAAAVLALALAAPAAAAPRLSKADRAGITRAIDVFVNHAVKRSDTTSAYDVVAPEMRPGISRSAWAKGDIPVYPFPAAGTTHPWNILYVTREEVGLELQLNPRTRGEQGPIIFHIYVRPAGEGRWLVDSFMPVATLAPLHAKKSSVRSVRDFSPQVAGGVSLGGSGPGRLSSVYLLVPFGLVGATLLGLACWGLVRVVRNRRLAAPRGGSLPPLPRSGA